MKRSTCILYAVEVSAVGNYLFNGITSKVYVVYARGSKDRVSIVVNYPG